MKRWRFVFLFFAIGVSLVAAVSLIQTMRSRSLNAHRTDRQSEATSEKVKTEMSLNPQVAVVDSPTNAHGGRISLRSLDLTRPPNELELRKAGQLGSPLTPSKPADPEKIADPLQRSIQQKDNLLFGRAMQEWNAHNYSEAVKLFREHRSQFPDSPWAGEAELHMGCNAQFSGSWDEAKFSFDWIVNNTPAESDISQKAKLRRSVLSVEQGNLDGAIKGFTEMLASEKNWERTTYGPCLSGWLTRWCCALYNRVNG